MRARFPARPSARTWRRQQLEQTPQLTRLRPDERYARQGRRRRRDERRFRVRVRAALPAGARHELGRPAFGEREFCFEAGPRRIVEAQRTREGYRERSSMLPATDAGLE